MDDQPVWLVTRRGRLVSVHSLQEQNGTKAVVLRQVSGAGRADMIVDRFDEMLAHGGRQPVVLGIASHVHLTGAAFRLRHFRHALQHVAAHRDRLYQP